MRVFLSCRTGAVLAAAFWMSAGALEAAPGPGGVAAAPVGRAAPALRQALPGRARFVHEGVRQRGFRAGFTGLRGNSAFGRVGAASFFTGGLGPASTLSRRGDLFAFRARDGGFYAFGGSVEAPYVEEPVNLHPGLPGLPVVIGIQETPVARPEITVVNGGSSRSSLRQSRDTGGLALNGPYGRLSGDGRAAFPGPRVYRVNVPPG